jgi:uncharacterized protein (DUF1015 family)
MPGPLDDRLRLLRATRTHLSPVYGTVAGPCAALEDRLRDAAGPPAPFLASDEQGVQHRMWRLPPDAEVAGWLAPQQLLIADGHHRYTTALAYRDERHAADGPGLWDRVLALIVDAGSEELTVLPFHRIQSKGPVLPRGTPCADLAGVLRKVSDDDVVVGLATRAAGALAFRTLHLSGDAPAVRALHDGILDPAVRPEDLRFVSDAQTAADAVADGRAVAAWFLPPTTPERIRKVVERGDRLPQKSTYFWPKPRSGMVMMPLDR